MKQQPTPMPQTNDFAVNGHQIALFQAPEDPWLIFQIDGNVNIVASASPQGHIVIPLPMVVYATLESAMEACDYARARAALAEIEEADADFDTDEDEEDDNA